MASAAWRAVAVSTPARVPVLAASLWPPRALALQRAVVLPQEPAQALAVALTPRALVLQRVVVLMPRALVLPLAFAPTRALVQGPRAALGSVLPGPSYVCTAGLRHRSDLLYGSEIDCWCRRAVLVRPRRGPQSKRANPGKCVS